MLNWGRYQYLNIRAKSKVVKNRCNSELGQAYLTKVVYFLMHAAEILFPPNFSSVLERALTHLAWLLFEQMWYKISKYLISGYSNKKSKCAPGQPGDETTNPACTRDWEDALPEEQSWETIKLVSCMSVQQLRILSLSYFIFLFWSKSSVGLRS